MPSPPRSRSRAPPGGTFSLNTAADETKDEDVEAALREPLLQGHAQSDSEGLVGAKPAGGSRKEEEKPKPVPFTQLFYFADKVDLMMMGVGALAACGVGVVMPLFSIIFGDILDAFYGDDPSDEVDKNALYFLYLAVSAFALNMTMNTMFSISSERQIRRMRETYLRSALRQEIGWFDTSKPGELSTRIKGDTLVVQEGIGIKLGRLIQFLSMFVAGFTIGFVNGWELALVMLSAVPALALAAGIMLRSVGSFTAETQKSTAEAGNVAEEVISSIRTVAAFTGERKELARYDTKLTEAMNTGIRAGIRIGLSLGLMMLIIFCSYGLGMWYGATEVARDLERGCVGENCKTGGDVLTVFWAVLQGAMSIGQMGPNLQALAEARGAATNLLAVSKRKPLIDSDSNEGLRPVASEVQGHLELREVGFTYPSRPEKKVFDGFNLTVKPGTTVALVGSSGNGKSTVINLVERFYDPQEGGVFLDGADVRKVNIKWLRNQLGLVAQEPVLFATTIARNIEYGRQGASRAEIEEAARRANAYEFITAFPDGFDTDVGERGVQLSGGQKQRVAIARAILKDPTVLLLDEATSALDAESERVVQQALDQLLAMKRRTTIIVAHRLSTIRNADKICVVEAGRVVEEGRHEELIANPDGKYSTLVRLQIGPGDEGDGEGDEPPPQMLAKQRQRSLSSSASWRSLRRSTSRRLSEEPSDAEVALLKEEMAEGEETPLKVPRSRLWALGAPERNYFLLALGACTFSGSVFPAFSLILSTIITFFYIDDPDKLESKASFWSAMFVVLAVVVGTANYVQIMAFTQMGQRLTARLRRITFRGILRQDVGWFDEEDNSTGALTARLATEATLVKNVTGTNLGRLYQNFITIVAAFLISLIAGSPFLTIILAAIMPILVLSSTLQMKVVTRATSKSQESVAKAGKVAVQAIDGIRTVASFNLLDRVMDLYTEELSDPLKQGVKRGLADGFMLGFSQLVTLGGYGFVFWFGGHRVIDGEIDFNRMLKSLMAVMMAAQGVGQTTSFLGDSAAATAAAARIFSITDRRPAIDTEDEEGARLDDVKGHIQLRGVHFRYPARPEAKVFRSFNVTVEPGSTVALVGASGSGKSTVVNLVLRFYDPEQGAVLLDGVDIRTLNVRWLRKEMGLVSQEPVLFATTIRENIAYGADGAMDTEVEEAARKANAHNFISSFPDGYDTEVGEKGVQLSGGQKQRVAIARAILKDPTILLLDEATSALDTESERVVQEALDQLLQSRRRTTIVIAHRLSTVRHADKICVVHAGKVVEEGSHEKLMDLPNGHYRLLVNTSLGGGGGGTRGGNANGEAEADGTSDAPVGPAPGKGGGGKGGGGKGKRKGGGKSKGKL